MGQTAETWRVAETWQWFIARLIQLLNRGANINR
jgi:hypothetical protein